MDQRSVLYTFSSMTSEKSFGMTRLQVSSQRNSRSSDWYTVKISVVSWVTTQHTVSTAQKLSKDKHEITKWYMHGY